MTRTIPLPIAESLRKLIPLLASDQDGEVISAVKAINRKLRTAGFDIFDLAANLGMAERPANTLRLPPKTWSEMARYCLARCERLSDRERKFVSDIASLLASGAAPTEKQANWLRKLNAKLQDVMSS